MALSFVKSFTIRSPIRDGYINKIIQPDTVNEEEDEESSFNQQIINNQVQFVCQNNFDLDKNETKQTPINHRFCCKLNPSMIPEDLSQISDDYTFDQFDEYGFNLETNKKNQAKLFVNDQNENKEYYLLTDNDFKQCKDELKEKEVRSKWIAYLELNYNQSASSQMRWSQVEKQMRHCKALDDLVKAGLPHSMRSELWMRFSKGLTLKIKSKWNYAQICDQSNHVDSLTDKQILGILPSNVCFMTVNSIGVSRLRRILRVIKWISRSGSSFLSEVSETVNVAIIAAHLLLICDEEHAFWLTLTCIDELQSIDHQAILKKLIMDNCPEIDEILKQEELDISLITYHWFASLFAGYLPKTSLLYTFWDFYFYYGLIVLFQLTIGLLLEKKHFFKTLTSATLFNRLSDLPFQIVSQKVLINLWETGLSYFDYIKQDWIKPYASSVNLNSFLLTFPFFTSSDFSNSDLKTKNIRQTFILIELHQAIVAIGKHFEHYDSCFHFCYDTDFSKIDLLKNEKEESVYSQKVENGVRRAKALIDFKRHDLDELGFRKNDIITVISEKDEHCWIGELNGVKGWFPAKFVEVLDESNGLYSIAGDDKAIPFINDLVRGRLCNILKLILCYGLKKAIFISIHPWNVIETIASSCIETDFNSVFSRLVLTRTFKLDEFALVLSPCEMLYRSVAYINKTHEYEPLDIKLRSLICIGLNQKILHQWFRVICASQPTIISKYYHNISFVNTPVWKMIVVELRLLTQFSFNLNILGELKKNDQSKSPVSKEGVKDMLIKHHLFSWDI